MAPVHSPKIKILWHQVTVKAGLQNHSADGASSAVSLYGLTQVASCCVRASGDGVAQAGKKQDPQLTDGWPKLRWESDYSEILLEMFALEALTQKDVEGC